MIYLDDAATAPMLPTVKAKLQELLELDVLGNAAALHTPGQQAKQWLEEARSNVARLINANPEEIIFTAGGSESNNTVINTFRGQKIAVSSIEHPSILEAARALAGDLVKIPVDEQGKVKLSAVFHDAGAAAMQDTALSSAGEGAALSAARQDIVLTPAMQDVALISVMLANNELGTIQPIAELAKQVHNKSKTLVHTDATQALGKIHIDVRQLGVDYMTMSAHKIGGPLGVGALYVRKGAPLTPLIFGGHQEHKKRAGTSNVFGIVGFGEAAKWAWEHWSCKKYRELAKLRNQLCERILAEVPYSSVNGYRVCVEQTGTTNVSSDVKKAGIIDILPDTEKTDMTSGSRGVKKTAAPNRHCAFNTLPNILNMSFQAAEGESIQLYLDAAGIAVSTGSACAAGDIQPSHVLMATRGDAEVAHSSIRFSLGLDTTADDIDAVMRVLPGIIKRLQDMSAIKIGAEDE